MSEREETPDVMGQLQGLGKPEPTKNTKTSASRLKGRATYDIGPELKEVIRAESVRLGVPASQLARYLLLFAWDDYANGRIAEPETMPSNSPAYRNVIVFED